MVIKHLILYLRESLSYRAGRFFSIVVGFCSMSRLFHWKGKNTHREVHDISAVLCKLFAALVVLMLHDIM